MIDTINFNHIVPSSLSGVVRRIWVEEYWHEAEVWGSKSDTSGNTLDTLVWAGTTTHTKYEDARSEAENMTIIIKKEIEINS